jgi:hypothetical protein
VRSNLITTEIYTRAAVRKVKWYTLTRTIPWIAEPQTRLDAHCAACFFRLAAYVGFLLAAIHPQASPPIRAGKPLRRESQLAVATFRSFFVDH